MFHHDGPFDACNPDRNRKGAKAAPMKAFAKDSINNTLGGSGPVNSNLDLNQFHGRGAEGFTDYSTSGMQNTPTDCYEPYAGASAPVRRGYGVRPGVDRTTSYNPVAKVEPVHGDESLGLGTSTFLEGAPASRVAMERRESESEHIAGNGGGLGRKKSIVQKIRGISNANRNLGHSSRVTSPEGHYESPASPTSPGDVQSSGGMLKIKETNPFFTDYDDAYEKKGAQIQIVEERNRVEESSTTRGRAVSSPKRGHPGGLLERRVTHDGAGTGVDSDPKKEGFLSRVKSLKGGRRARPERRE